MQANPAGAGERYLSRGVTETSAYRLQTGVSSERHRVSRVGVAVVVAQAAARVKRNAGKTGKAAWGVLSLRIVVRVVRVVRVVCGGRAGITPPRVSIVVLFLAYELVALARCACGLWRRENLSRVLPPTTTRS